MLRILSFNIHGGYDMKGRRDLRRVRALLDNLDIDIAVFQEMETRPSYGGTPSDVDVLAGPGRAYHLPDPITREGEGWYGNLIVSRHPIARAIVHDLETKKVLEPRHAVDALIDAPQGRIRLIGTHLSLIATMRWWEVNNLIRLMNEVEDEMKCPLFFVGDFNEWLWTSKLIRHLDKLMIPLPAGRSFPSFFPLFRLDRAWYDAPDPAHIIAEAQVLTGPEARALSDHLPLLIEISRF